jgi:hypothetical protein
MGKEEKYWSEFNKIERLLITYHQFKYGIAPSLRDFPAKTKKTFERDCNVLRKTGVRIKYDRKNKGYISSLTSDSQIYADYIPTGNIPEERLIRRLIRLMDVMNSLVEGESVSEWYKQNYPNVTARTRQRDLVTLCNIGYKVEYVGNIGVEMGYGKWLIDFPLAFL